MLGIETEVVTTHNLDTLSKNAPTNEELVVTPVPPDSVNKKEAEKKRGNDTTSGEKDEKVVLMTDL